MTKKAKPFSVKDVWVEGVGYSHDPLRLGIYMIEDMLVYKKCQTKCGQRVLVTLKLKAGTEIIFGEANKTLKNCPRIMIQSLIRGGGFGKCRTNEAKVVSMKRLVFKSEKGWRESNSSRPIKTAYSMHDSTFKYVVGKTVQAPLAQNQFEDCLSGIHFFCTKKEALNY
jgi:hypothetical protein